MSTDKICHSTESTITKMELIKSLNYERSEKEFLKNIIGKLPGHIYWLDRKNVYLGCNDSQAEDFGLKSRDEIVGKTNYDLLSFEEAEILNKVNNTVMDTGHVYEEEESISSVHGRPGDYLYLSKKAPLFDIHGKIVGLLGVSIDITERKRAEELQRKLKIQQEFYEVAKGLARSVNSPIVALKMIEYISADKLSEIEKKMLKMAIESVEKATTTLSALRMVSGVPVGSELPEEEKKKLDISIKSVEKIANTLLQNCIKMQEAKFEKSDTCCR
ncbi:MAG: PAS domain-containing protein [Endomicrobium sp.]|nr:PAS domain-containing protein [Endomicrobium sp.]